MITRSLSLLVFFIFAIVTALAQRVTYNKVWQVSIPTTNSAFGTKMFALDDANYIIGYQSAPGPYYQYFMKVDSSGNKLWNKSIADAGIVELIKANDGGYVLVLNDYNTTHFLVIKLTVDGNEVWRKTFAGTSQDQVADIVSIDATSYLILATSNSNHNATKTNDSHGGNDFWALKIDNNGNKIWDKTFGGADNESALSILPRGSNFVLNGSVSDVPWVVWINKNGSSGKAMTINTTNAIGEMLDFTYAASTGIPNADFTVDSTFITGSAHFSLVKPGGQSLFEAPLGDGIDDFSIRIENVKPLLDKRVLFTWSSDWGLYLFDGANVTQLQTDEGPFNYSYTESIGYTPSLDIVGASGNIGSEPGRVTVTRHRAPEFYLPVFYYSIPQHNLAYNNTVYFNYLGCQWVDYTNDGVLDFMIYNEFSPFETSTSTNTHLFTNSGAGKFSFQKSFSINVGGPPWSYGSTSMNFGDFNHDGYEDFATWNDIYLNNKNKDFVKTPINVGGSIKNWGDVDQDGDYDLFVPSAVLVNNGAGVFTSRAPLANEETNYGEPDLLGYPLAHAKHFYNTAAGDQFAYGSRQSIGDVDNDSDNDRLVFNGGEIIIYENRTTVVNQRPTIPQNLTKVLTGQNVTFSWSPSTDDNTNANAISYNVYLRRGVDTLVSSNSFRPTGVRKIPEPGNAKTTSFTFKGVTVGTYYWSVQAVDGSYRGSQFAAEQTFFYTNNPTNITLSGATIPENSGATIGTLTTVDTDLGETFTYSPVAGTGSTDNALFKITGNALSALSATSLNFEIKSSYSIRIRTTDSRQGTFEKVFAITVTNVQETATDMALSALTIKENLPTATTIGALSDNDPDVGDTHTYTLVAGAGSTDNASFQIAGSALKSNVIFNYEVKATYSIRIQTSDQAGNSFQKVFAITITDENDLLKPALNLPTFITQTGFTLSWATVEGATGYEIDISSDNFVSLVAGYNPASGTSTSLAVINLSPGVTYQARVRALESTYKSPDSDPLSQITKPPNPSALDAIQIAVDGFKAVWSVSTSAVSYELEVSEGAGEFTPMPDYNPKQVTGANDILITGLAPSSAYKYRVRAINAAGSSGNSNETSVKTLDPDVTVTELLVTTLPGSAVFPAGAASVKIPLTITGGVGEKTVTLQWKGILTAGFTPIAVVKSDDRYEAEITSTLLDELGVEYYVEATDEAGTYVKQVSSSYLYKAISAGAIPIPFAAGFTGKTATYQMFSIPYELAQNDINKLFDVSLGGFDNTKWRLFHYQGEANKEYPNQLLELKSGEGYWFNTILSDIQIKLGAATVVQKNLSDPFVLTLAPKWNQIGNPYPFPIRWSDVIGASSEIDGLNFWSNGGYSERDVLKPWEGAFVFNSSSSSVSLPIPITSKSNGRLTTETLSATLDREAWKLAMSLSVGGLSVESGIGMHPEARASKDRYDRITLPRFIDYAEMNVNHPEFFVPHFATDVMPSSQEQSWTFDVASNLSGEKAELKWAYDDIKYATSSLVLIDLLDKTWVDMKSHGSYSFLQKEGRQIKILYSRNGEFLPGLTMAGACFPNPFSDEITLPLLLEKENMTIEVNIYNLLGQRVKTLSRSFQKAGMQAMVWDGKDELGGEVARGVLLYKVEDGSTGQVGRMIKR